MPQLSPPQIYALARDAGFNRGDAVTMTAIALAESGGNSDAKNITKREESYGLWQINVKANTDLRGMNLLDPKQNAKAAKIIKDRQGYGAWSVFTTNDPNRTYRKHLGTGLQAASTAEGGPGIADILRSLPTAAGTLTSVGADVAGEVASNVTDPLKAVGQIGGLMAKAGTWIGDPHNILRVVYVALGGALVLGALIMFSAPIAEPVAKVAGKAADIAL